MVDTALKNSLATTQSISNTTSTSSDPEIGHGETQATIGGDLSAEVSQQQVLKFVEEEPTIRESATVLPSPLSMDRMLSSAAVDMKQHTIKDFLQRPMILSSFQWTPNARSLLDQILPDNTVDGSNNLYQGIFPQDIIEGGRDSTMVFYETLWLSTFPRETRNQGNGQFTEISSRTTHYLRFSLSQRTRKQKCNAATNSNFNYSVTPS